ncbi:MAG: BrnT family toxin [Zoogloeaceae bacterium]|nr:BrnT family toxin [Zoogloeaceae bacterium]
MEKSARNVAERGLSFASAAEFDFETAHVWQDTRKAYPEARFVALGYLENRLHALIFSHAPGGIRVISFRKANRREGEKHGFQLTRD